MNRLIETVFSRRGYDKDFIKNINNPYHDDLKDIDVLCEKLKRIHDSGSKIVVLPDFDMDGIMSGVIGFAGLAELGFNVSLFTPIPSEGYDFTHNTIDRLVREFPDVKAIITCDTGISCYEGVAYAKSLGIEFLITDHHTQNADRLVDMKADCIVDPMRVDETYAHPGICGAYVLYQCIQFYADKYTDNILREQIRRLRVFAGIGTVSDSMPLRYENRQIVKDCVSVCRLLYSYGDSWFVNALQGCSVYRGAFIGLFNTLDKFASIGKIKDMSDINEDFIGFYLAPTFNSIKRMDDDMVHAFGVFFTAESNEHIDYLFSLNNERKELVAKYFDELVAQSGVQKYAPQIYVSDASLGILGLLATKLVNLSGLPTVVVRKCDDGIYRGSGRAPSWYPMITRCSAEGFYVAGHESAFGVGITDDRELKSFAAFLKKDVSDMLASVDLEEYKFKPDFVIATDGTGDTDIDIPLFAEYLHELETFRPFGHGFPAPVSVFKFKPSDCKWSVVGSLKQHLRLDFPYGFSVLCWNQSDKLNDARCASECFVQGNLVLNIFHDTHTINFTGDLSF